MSVCASYLADAPFPGMTVNWSILEGAIIVAVEGDYTGEELERAVSAALYSPKFPAGGALLFDGRRATTPATPEMLNHRATFIASLLDHGVISRCAAVVGEGRRPLAAFVQDRMRESGWEMTVFATIDEGRHWLAAPAAEAPVSHQG
jgi:hypothetical protein